MCQNKNNLLKILFKSENGSLRIVKDKKGVIKLQQNESWNKDKSKKLFIDICETHLKEVLWSWAKEYRLNNY